MVNSSPVEDVENSTGSLRIDGPSVRKRVGYQKMLCRNTVTVKRMLEYTLHHPFRGRATLPKATAGKGQAHQPVPNGWDLLRSGQPPPLATQDLIDDLFSLCIQPSTTVRLREAGTPFGQGQCHTLRVIPG